MASQKRPTPFLKMIEAQDQRNLPAGTSITTKRTHTVGFETKDSTAEKKTDTSEVHASVSGTYGFSAISSITAEVGGSMGSSTENLITRQSSLTGSTTTETTLTFPSGQFVGYYAWAVELDGHLCYLDSPTVAIKSHEEVTIEKTNQFSSTCCFIEYIGLLSITDDALLVNRKPCSNRRPNRC